MISKGMPFYIRKAISAGPFRFNLSKSGLGLSVGVRGLRVGAGPRGHYIHAGRGGLYYRASLNPAGRRGRSGAANGGQPHSSPPLAPSQSEPAVQMAEVDSGDVLAMRDVRLDELLTEMNAKLNQLSYAMLLSALSGSIGIGCIVVGNPIGVFFLLLALPAWLLGWWIDRYKRRSVLFYDLDREAAEAYEGLTIAFDTFLACSAKWHVEAQGAIDDPAVRKRNAGATGAIQRKPAKLKYRLPKTVASNITPPYIQLGKQSIYFFPDAAFVFDGKAVGAISYDSLKIGAEQDHFREQDKIPKDAKVVGKTWKYVNKSGGPDARFANNIEIPICHYETAHLGSESGLNEQLQFSRSGVVEPFATAVKKLAAGIGGHNAVADPVPRIVGGPATRPPIFGHRTRLPETPVQ